MGVSGDLVSLLNYLLPGFFAGWIFYSLTGHPQPTPLERTIQALICTVVIQAIGLLLREAMFWLHSISGYELGEWSVNVDLIVSLVLGFLLGHILAWIANHNLYHRCLYRLDVTKRTSYVSEWHSAFWSANCFIILHINDSDESRRHLLGWPYKYPDDPTKGHFVMQDAEWLIPTTDGREYERRRLNGVEKVVIPASSVTMIEFILSPDHKDETDAGQSQAPRQPDKAVPEEAR